MTSPLIDERNADQISYWNGQGGKHWTEQQQAQDLVLAPASKVLIERAKIKQGEQIIDIGCGCGATTFDLAQLTGPKGHVTGVDISAPMLTRANDLKPPDAPIDFVQADATVYDFKPASVDLLFSRFGVMFFAQPQVSFANMRQALRPNGRLVFACWRAPRENPMLMFALKEVYEHVPRLPDVKPEDPGPFSFASDERVKTILSEAGFSSISLERVDLKFDIATGRGIEGALETVLAIGPASRALQDQPSESVAAATKSIRTLLAAHLNGNEVPLDGSIWIVTARNS